MEGINYIDYLIFSFVITETSYHNNGDKCHFYLSIILQTIIMILVSWKIYKIYIKKKKETLFNNIKYPFLFILFFLIFWI